MGSCFKNRFHGRQFSRLTPRHIFGRVVPTQWLQDRSCTGKYGRNTKCLCMEFNISSPDDHQSMHTGNSETRRCKCRQAHMKGLRKPGIIEHGLYRIYIKIFSIRVFKSGRTVHPGIRCNNEDARYESAYTHHHTRKPMEPFIEFPPAIEKEPERNGFNEESSSLERKRQSE